MCMSCNLDLTFDLVVVTFTFKFLSRLYLGNCKVEKVVTWCDLHMNFDLAIVTLSYKILSGLYLGNRKV